VSPASPPDSSVTSPRRSNAARRLPPGPPLPPRLQELLLKTQPLWMLEACRRRYGDAFTLRPGGPTRVVVSHPELIRAVFTAQPEVARAGESNLALMPIFGSRSILLSDGEDYLRKRRLLLAPFHARRIEAAEAAIEPIADEHLASWPRGEVFPLHERLRALSFDVLTRVIFGLDDRRVREDVALAFDRLMRASTPPSRRQLLYRLSGRSLWNQFWTAKAETERLLAERIAAVRARGGHGDGDGDRDASILELLVAARDESGRPMSDEELRDELTTLIVAGHESTASTLSWLFHFVLRDRRLYAELRSESAGEDTPRLDAAIAEAQRLGPVIPWMGRALAEPFVVGDWVVPAGMLVVASAYLVHRRPDIYDDPLRFRPDRFRDGNAFGYAFIPFGGGPRRCLGAGFATLEVRTIARTVLRRVDLRSARRRAARPERRGPIYAPRGGVPVRVVT
jgi:cytochrome P450 family 135